MILYITLLPRDWPIRSLHKRAGVQVLLNPSLDNVTATARARGGAGGTVHPLVRIGNVKKCHVCPSRLPLIKRNTTRVFLCVRVCLFSAWNCDYDNGYSFSYGYGSDGPMSEIQNRLILLKRRRVLFITALLERTFLCFCSFYSHPRPWEFTHYFKGRKDCFRKQRTHRGGRALPRLLGIN